MSGAELSIRPESEDVDIGKGERTGARRVRRERRWRGACSYTNRARRSALRGVRVRAEARARAGIGSPPAGTPAVSAAEAFTGREWGARRGGRACFGGDRAPERARNLASCGCVRRDAARVGAARLFAEQFGEGAQGPGVEAAAEDDGSEDAGFAGVHFEGVLGAALPFAQLARAVLHAV